MAAPTVDQLVSMLTANGQGDTAAWLQANPSSGITGTGVWGTPATPDGGTTSTGSGGLQLAIAPNTPSVAALLANAKSGITWNGTSWQRTGGITGGGASPLVTAPGTPGALNVPYGSDYFAPTLDAATKLQLAALQNGQFQQTATMTAAQALAQLYAQGPQSSAELAFLNGGMGLPAIGGGAYPIASLIRSSTQGGSAQGSSVGLGDGTAIGIPSTLGGRALQQLQADPNLAGVIASFAKAAGNPDLLARSASAALPSDFAVPRYRVPVGPGMGL